MSKLTVSELISELEDCDPDAELHIHCSGAFTELRNVEQQEVTWNTGEKETVVELR